MQADPIRAPARAPDLILRHRVAGYRVGDLERRFARLGLEEDFLYAYGFMPRDTVRLLHPRDPESSGRLQVPGDLAAEVLAFVRDRGPTHPADLGAALRPRAGGERLGPRFSKATTRVLQSLHYHGLLRVAGRRDGIRIYEAAVPHPDPLLPDARSREIALLVIGILAPLAEAGLAATFGLLGRGAPGLGGWRKTVAALLAGRRTSRAAKWTASAISGRPVWRCGEVHRMRCACWRRSIRSCGSGGGSSICGDVGFLPVRGLHQAGAAPVRLLRDAAAAGLRRHRLGQRQPQGRTDWTPNSALWARGRGNRHSGAVWTQSWARWRVS